MNKTTKKLMLITLIVSLIIASVSAFQVLLVANVAPLPFNVCVEYDEGIAFDNPGAINGTFVIGNQTFSGLFPDTCLSNTTIIEMVCGKSINQNYKHLAAALVEDCAVVHAGNSTALGVCAEFGGWARCI